MSQSDPGPLSYEQALALLEEQVDLLETGNLGLEQAIMAVETGRRYLTICRQKLEEARKTMEVRPESPTGVGLEAPPDL